MVPGNGVMCKKDLQATTQDEIIEPLPNVSIHINGRPSHNYLQTASTVTILDVPTASTVTIMVWPLSYSTCTSTLKDANTVKDYKKIHIESLKKLNRKSKRWS